MHKIAPEIRFRKFVGAQDANGCRTWRGSLSDYRYGSFYDGKRVVKAHVFAWEKENGPIPNGLKVCHSCDIPACVEVSHLFLGTQKKNLEDMVAKKRSCYGERSGHAKLTAEQAIAIKQSADRTGVLAKRYGVSAPTICGIRSGYRWKYLHAID
jgi:hypothetical protein